MLKPLNIALVLAVVGGASLAQEGALSPADMTGRELVAQVNARDDGAQVTRRISFELTDRRGNVRLEETFGYRKYFGEDKRTILFYTEPTNVRGTGFLTFDYVDPEVDDDQWLYLPALRKVRRISASDRGDYFLGTDFTYEEIKKEQKVEIADYTFAKIGEETIDGFRTYVVEGTPVSERIAKDLGYSRVVWRVDPEIWMSRFGEYYDLNGNLLKTIRIEEVETIDGVLTATQIFVENAKTRHSTRLRSTDIDYEAQVDDGVFSQTRLRRGL